MLLAAEVTRTFTPTEFLLALCHAVAFVGGMLWVKAVLYRRRARDKAERLRQAPKINESPQRWHSHSKTTPQRNHASHRAMRRTSRSLEVSLNRASTPTDNFRIGFQRYARPLRSQISTHPIKVNPMKTRNIIITAPDHARLSGMIAFATLSERESREARALEAELKSAEIVPPEAVPPDVVTMNSRASLLDLDTGERMEFTLVLPGEADVAEGKISVLAPIGAGMLGYRVGDSFERHAPDGMRRLKVTEVSYQPEAALAPVA
jgi:regulator of nucleoside diphosphate kinase